MQSAVAPSLAFFFSEKQRLPTSRACHVFVHYAFAVTTSYVKTFDT